MLAQHTVKKVMMVGLDKVRGNKQKHPHMQKGKIWKNVLILFSPYKKGETQNLVLLQQRLWFISSKCVDIFRPNGGRIVTSDMVCCKEKLQSRWEWKSSAIVIIFFSTSYCLAIPNYEDICAIAVEIRADKCSFLRTVSSIIVVIALEQLLTCHQCF